MTKPNGAAGKMSTQGLQEGVESVCRVTDCAHPELLLALVGFLLTAAFLLLAGATLVRLRDAREAVATERRRAKAERDAFERFHRRVSRLETNDPRPPDTDPPGGGGGAVVAGSAAVESGNLAAVRRAYDETVMSTPHHAAEYDETLTESMAAEFNGAVASTVASGTTLTPALHQTLRRGATQAKRRREEVLSDLDGEEAALDRAEETLRPAVEATEDVTDQVSDASFVDLVADTERLDWYEREVEELVSARQREIHDHESEHPHWFDYLYGDLQSGHPILGAAMETLHRIDSVRDRVAAAAASQQR
jgi:hypothetical protein